MCAITCTRVSRCSKLKGRLGRYRGGVLVRVGECYGRKIHAATVHAWPPAWTDTTCLQPHTDHTHNGSTSIDVLMTNEMLGERAGVVRGKRMDSSVRLLVDSRRGHGRRLYLATHLFVVWLAARMSRIETKSLRLCGEGSSDGAMDGAQVPISDHWISWQWKTH